MSRRRLIVGAQVVLGLFVVLFVALEIASSWRRVGPRLADLHWGFVVLAAIVLAFYYLVFVVGWQLILRGFGLRIGYADAVGAEMVSMLAKYVPGGVWTPAARVVACRRLGLEAGPVLASIAYEAGLSAVAGVAVLALALPFTPHAELPVPGWSLALFVAVLLCLLHPRIFGPLADRLVARLGDGPLPRLPLSRALGVFVFYAVTWLVGGVVLLAMARSLTSVPLSAVPYLGGASALGAIAAVLVVFAPSGLGVREGAVYALLLAYVDRDVALVTVALNRILLTGVEAGLLGGVALLRRRRTKRAGGGEIRTRRLILRPLSRAEAQATLSGERDGRAWGPGYPTEGDVEVARVVAQARPGLRRMRGFGAYQVIDAASGLAIGGIGFFGPPDDEGVVRVGYGISLARQGEGIATEALEAVVRWAFAQRRVARVAADTQHDNAASRRVLEKAGMRFVGADAELRHYELAAADARP